MARMHGSQVRAYLGSRDVSGDLSEITPKMAADMHEATTFASAGWKETDPGLLGWEAGWTGFFGDAAGGYAVQLAAILGTNNPALSIYTGDADAIGDKGALFGAGAVKTYDAPTPVADLVKLNGEMSGSGRAGYNGRLLHPLGDETGTGVESSLDNTSASIAGGRANLHVTALTGTWTIKIQQSSDNGGADPWADLVTFTQVAEAGGPTSESKEVAGAVKRYLRVTSTEDVAGTITFVCGFARY